MQMSQVDQRTAEVNAEQAHLDLAHHALAAMRERAARALEQARHDAQLSSSLDDAAAIEATLIARLENLADTRAALCFGRIDEEAPGGKVGDRWHIGRRHVEGADGEPVVLDWRVPVAIPFYRATWADPQGLRLRRRLAVEQRTVAGLFDEDFTDPDGADNGGGVPDPLLAELERGRSGEMRDIVATIQAEQDVIIRASVNDLVIVQGGPGTGKTAVGLHRAAFLLYEHRRELERQGLLVVGPNELFLRYIGQVLPSLGERAVTQTTVERVHGMAIARTTESDPAVAQMKGDARMATVIHRAVFGSIRPADQPVELTTGFAIVTLTADEINEVQQRVLQRDLPSNDAREVFRAQLTALCWKAYLRKPTSNEGFNESFHRELRTNTVFKKLVDTLWPSFTAVGLIRTLLSSPKALATAADGVLTAAEQKLLHRRKASTPKEERWTRQDLALLDEAQATVAGLVRTYGHVVVDEAQDLSDMELRMVGRRSPDRSLTVLGDLAQATSVGAQRSWTQALAHLRGADQVVPLDGDTTDGTGETGGPLELTLGYRVPAPILELANRLLPIAAPHVTPSSSVRVTGREPVRVASPELLDQVERLRTAWTTVAVIGPVAQLDELLTLLDDIKPADARRGESLDEGVTVLGAVASKGLEFDAVIVVEPDAIVNENGLSETERGRGYRALYVALTRAVQELVVVGDATVLQS
jgi:DNA helicase IV